MTFLSVPLMRLRGLPRHPERCNRYAAKQSSSKTRVAINISYQRQNRSPKGLQKQEGELVSLQLDDGSLNMHSNFEPH